MDTTRKATARRVTEAMKTGGLTRRDLSDFTGIAYTTLFRKLNGHSPFTLDDIASIAAVLEVKPDTLVEFPEEEDAA